MVNDVAVADVTAPVDAGVEGNDPDTLVVVSAGANRTICVTLPGCLMMTPRRGSEVPLSASGAWPVAAIWRRAKFALATHLVVIRNLIGSFILMVFFISLGISLIL